MSLLCEVLASLLLIFSFSTKNAVSKTIKVVWGTLDQDVILDIPGFQMKDSIDDIRWDKGGNMVAQLRKDKRPYQLNETYEVLANGTLKIKHLQRDFNGTYNVDIYDTGGKNVLQKAFALRILERVSKPKIFWDCSNTTLTCEVVKGTDLELNLYQNGKHLRKEQQKVIIHKGADLNVRFKCTASNKVSEESSVADTSCSEKGPYFYLLGGSVLLVLLVALLIVYGCKRKAQRHRRKEEQPEIKAHKVATEERGLKPPQIPASFPQNPGASQAPPTPGHRPQAPAHRPLASGHRVQHQQQKRPPPSGSQVHQQRGPPLPRPRVQQKPPRGAPENALPPSSN